MAIHHRWMIIMVLLNQRIVVMLMTVFISFVLMLTLPATAIAKSANGRNGRMMTEATSNNNNNNIKERRINEKIRRKYLTVQRTLDCHERSFTFKAVQTDPVTGLQCRDYIRLLSCWGRCNSGEISDYRFPYKRSFHNVCIHDVVEKRLFELTDCDAGAPEYLRSYETVVAKSCVCRRCETSMVNCESASIDLDYM
nr:thyrostimulin beta-5 subunit-like [Dermatophagoides farinae]